MKAHVMYKPRYAECAWETRYVDVLHTFTVKVMESEYTLFVHRVIDNPTHFSCSDYISGRNVAGADYETIKLAEEAGRRRIDWQIRNFGEKNTWLQIETQHMDDQRNNMALLKPAEEDHGL